MRYFTLALVLFLAACEPTASQFTPGAIPDGLKDCSFYDLNDGNGRILYVVRCPNSSTSTNYDVHHGKTSTHYSITAIDN